MRRDFWTLAGVGLSSLALCACWEDSAFPIQESEAGGVAGTSSLPSIAGGGNPDKTSYAGTAPGGSAGATSGGSAGSSADSGPGGTSGGVVHAGGEGGAVVRCDSQPSCNLGDFECDGADLYLCDTDREECPTWSFVTTCEDDLSVCNSELGACECDPEEPPRCTDDDAVARCENGLWTETPCPDETPLCNAEAATCECDPSVQPAHCDADGVTLLRCEGGAWVGTTCLEDTPVCNPDTDRCECEPDTAPQCSGSTLRVCSDGQWSETECSGATPDCNATDERCDCSASSAPDECTDSTTLRRCVAGQIESVTCASLDSTLPACNPDTDQCECTSEQPSYCDGSTFIQCSGGSWESQSCIGATPACDGSAGCVPCSEHSQCPDSACHLSEFSSYYGSCFPTSSVQAISSAGGLQTALENLTDSTVAVYRLPSMSYPVSTLDDFNGTPIPAGAEIAIIGTGSTAITGATSGVYGWAIPLLEIAGIVYLGSVDIRSPATVMTAIEVSGSSQQSPPPSLWLDDVNLTEFHTALRMGNVEVHIRRSVVRSTDNYSIRAEGGGLYVENSVLGPDDTVPSYNPLLAIGTYLDVRYSNLWGSDWAIDCTDSVDAPTRGTIRNSILLNQDASAVSIDPDCTEVTSTGNAGTGLAVNPQSTWFTNIPESNFHLTTTGANQLGTTAQWAAGDPLVDIDGEARPQDSRGYAGIDQR